MVSAKGSEIREAPRRRRSAKAWGPETMRALFICRREADADLSAEEVAVLGRLLQLDNLDARPARVCRGHGAVCMLFNPPSRVETAGASVVLGRLGAGAPDWARPGAAAPDGAYALIRVDCGSAELVADAVASRTLWYRLTRNLFVASTSQRALAAVTGSFEPNRDALSWMLSSGTLGPEAGWDARVRQVPPGGRVKLDRSGWRLTVEAPAIELGPRAGDAADADAESQCRGRLEDALARVFEALRFDYARWLLPLSGGVDSRGVLLMLRDRRGLRSVTWGVKEAQADRAGDVAIAADLAAHFRLSHRFFPIAVSREPRDRLIERFLVAGEGRTDRVSGYLDGFAIWRTLAEQQCDGVIRGDEVMGWTRVRSEANVRAACRFTLLDDVLDADSRERFGLSAQTLPPNLVRRPAESLPAWRDRTYQQFAMPALLAALTDLKAAYVEVVNPLLFNGIVDCVRRLPDGLRTDKRLWRRLVERLSPAIPFARRTAVYPLAAFVAEPATLELMLDEFASTPARSALGEDFAARLRCLVDARRSAAVDRPAALPLRRGLARRLAEAGRRRLGGGRPALAPEILAFRALLAVRMYGRLRRDQHALAAVEGAQAHVVPA